MNIHRIFVAVVLWQKGQTPADFATQNCDSETLKVLKEIGADMNGIINAKDYV